MIAMTKYSKHRFWVNSKFDQINQLFGDQNEDNHPIIVKVINEKDLNYKSSENKVYIQINCIENYKKL